MENYDYRLVSSGGVGSCAVERWVADRLTMKGWSAHQRDPRIEPQGRPVRVLYIVGNPYNQLLSFHRRGFLKAPYTHCRHVAGDVDGLSARDEWTVEEYVRNGVDYFRLQSHFAGWWEYRARDYEIMFVRYETMPHVLDAMRLFFCKTTPFRFEKRVSNVFGEPSAVMEGLVDMYGPFAAQVCKLPDVVVKRRNDQ